MRAHIKFFFVGIILYIFTEQDSQTQLWRVKQFAQGYVTAGELSCDLLSSPRFHIFFMTCLIIFPHL